MYKPDVCTGTALHAEDEAYEEAAYLKTNRFVAAYVVDEQSRASYVNDLLNERAPKPSPRDQAQSYLGGQTKPTEDRK